MSVGSRAYHDQTKHSPQSVRASRHRLDWANQPRPFKQYLGLEAMPLPPPGDGPPAPALPALAACRVPSAAALDLAALARLLFLSAGVVRTRRYPGGQVMHFRAAACTGALYHIDLYLVAGALPGLAAGVYHFAPHDFALRRLRDGDWRAALVEASGGAPAVARAPALLVCASTFWRNAWKYQARAYRHAYWDGGTLLANLLAVCAAEGIAAEVVLGFADAAVNRLVDLDGRREAAIALVALGAGAPPPPVAASPAPLALATEPLSAHEVEYPLIVAAHAASALPDGAAARAWRAARADLVPADADPSAAAPPSPAAAIPLRPLATPPPLALGRTIRRRGSARDFTAAALSFGALSTLLQAATGGVPFDLAAADCRPLVEPFLIVNAVEGLDAGTYALTADRRALLPLRRGDLRAEAGFLALGQDLAAEAALNVYLLADLDRLLAAGGERAYRAAQLAGGIAGGRCYLAATALGLGATGLTFFDDAVIEALGPHAAGRSVMFLVAAGPVASRRPA